MKEVVLEKLLVMRQVLKLNELMDMNHHRWGGGVLPVATPRDYTGLQTLAYK